MASAVASQPPADPEQIRVYHLTSAEHAISDIALGRLKVARFSDLNDPFELLAVNFRERHVRNVIRDFKSAYDARTGLLCFSSDWAEPVLWSHYAEKHRGICLGFNVNRNLLQEVKYEDQRLRAELGDDQNPLFIGPELQEQLLKTKFGGWSYEQEYRRFISLEEAIQEGRLNFVLFGYEMALAEVILGPQCNHSLQSIRDFIACRYADVVTYQARLAFKWFSVVPNELTIP
jgi:Protein of unknown function (DUF2971)